MITKYFLTNHLPGHSWNVNWLFWHNKLLNVVGIRIWSKWVAISGRADILEWLFWTGIFQILAKTLGSMYAFSFSVSIWLVDNYHSDPGGIVRCLSYVQYEWWTEMAGTGVVSGESLSQDMAHALRHSLSYYLLVSTTTATAAARQSKTLSCKSVQCITVTSECSWYHSADRQFIFW